MGDRDEEGFGDGDGRFSIIICEESLFVLPITPSPISIPTTPPEHISTMAHNPTYARLRFNLFRRRSSWRALCINLFTVRSSVVVVSSCGAWGGCDEVSTSSSSISMATATGGSVTSVASTSVPDDCRVVLVVVPDAEPLWRKLRDEELIPVRLLLTVVAVEVIIIRVGID